MMYRSILQLTMDSIVVYEKKVDEAALFFLIFVVMYDVN